MDSLFDVQVKGLTAFASPPTAKFCYVISLKGAKVNICLRSAQGRNSEYIWCLDCPLGKEEDAERKLTLQKGGKLQLELSLKIRLLHSARIICYAFKLQTDSVERMDILESKLKDQQEELQKLRSKVDASNVFLCAECEVLMETKLQWKEINSETFVLDDDNTSIRMAIVLEMNGAEIQTAAICYASCYDNGDGFGYTSHQTSTSLMCITPVAKDAHFSVVCLGATLIPSSASYMTVGH
ncbi:hypothetical protein PC123_g24109 [Phytophthora cactorum]|nr:hypothetical protein PC123_g24109 [Phytophthora cactorum]